MGEYSRTMPAGERKARRRCAKGGQRRARVLSAALGEGSRRGPWRRGGLVEKPDGARRSRERKPGKLETGLYPPPAASALPGVGAARSRQEPDAMARHVTPRYTYEA